MSTNSLLLPTCRVMLAGLCVVVPGSISLRVLVPRSVIFFAQATAAFLWAFGWHLPFSIVRILKHLAKNS